MGAAIVGEGFFRRPLNSRHGLLHRQDVVSGTPQFHDAAGGYVLVCNNALRGPSSRHGVDPLGLEDLAGVRQARLNILAGEVVVFP